MKRRKFLQNSSSLIATSSFGYHLLGQLLVNSFIANSKSEAQELQTSLNYVNIFMPGAPLRFMFDQWLRTTDSEPNLVFNNMTANAYQVANGKVVGVTNKEFLYNGFKVPYLFSQSVTVSSGIKNISTLLDSMLVMRGFGTGFDGHAFNGAAQMAPLGGAPSINGLVADSSKKIFEAIQSPNRGGYHAFTSQAGKAINVLPIDNPLATLLEGFKRPAHLKARNLKESQSIAFEEAKTKLRQFSSKNSQASEILNSNISNAEKMIKKGIGNLEGYWNEAILRYRGLIQSAIRTSGIHQINNEGIFSDESSLWNIQADNVYTLAKDFNLQSAIENSMIALLSEGLALVEYILSEDLGQSIEIFAGNFENLKVFLKGESTSRKLFHNHDMHGTGAMANIFIMNSYYRGLSAGLLELIDKLKAKNIWNKTLIQVSSEFGRSTRTDGSGSDHGFNQMVTSIFSGTYSAGPYLVGNISKSGHPGEGYLGTQGVGVEIKNYNQKGRPTPLMAASTIAQLLNVNKNPYVNLAEPLVKNKDGILVYQFEKGKIVDG
ncbi:MAG: DUF1501 domain-containing protein [Bdellovibrionaceae bacterium]|nr:DUF1501 domain-containing protein [Pseudobdellovibrionaceae bacterium]